jgi:hypothetical protein
MLALDKTAPCAAPARPSAAAMTTANWNDLRIADPLPGFTLESFAKANPKLKTFPDRD